MSLLSIITTFPAFVTKHSLVLILSYSFVSFINITACTYARLLLYLCYQTLCLLLPNTIVTKHSLVLILSFLLPTLSC
jgi:hypothetical protein